MDSSTTPRTCETCGLPYELDDVADSHMNPPDDYRFGYQRYCLACWLGVGPDDEYQDMLVELDSPKHQLSSAILEAHLRRMLAELDVPNLPLKAAANFYRNQVNIGMGWPERNPMFHFEIGIENDWDKCLYLLDAIVAPFEHSFSCGLARTVDLKNLAEVKAFYGRLGLAKAAGSFAWEILERERLSNQKPNA